MLKTFAILAAFSLAATTAVAAPTMDANGKCRDGGKFVAASMCKKPAPAPAKRCQDKTTKKFAKCGTPGAVPVK